MILFSWNELPSYGAKLISQAVAVSNEEVCVIATRAKVPAPNLEKICGARIIWVEPHDTINIESLFPEKPTIFFQAGWYVPVFMQVGSALKRKGVPIVLLADNSAKTNLRQAVGKWYFRLFLDRRFDAVWVPGESGRQFMRKNGVEESRIYDGLYGSDENIFFPRVHPKARELKVVFAGRMVAEKGVRDLYTAFLALQDYHDRWTLAFYGDGPLLAELDKTEVVSTSQFVSPESLAKVLGNSAIFCLPSHRDHWPLVINEASLSGAALLVSDEVGNRFEFCDEVNSRVHVAKDIDSLKFALADMMDLCEEDFSLIEKRSVELGRKFDARYFPQQFLKILSEIGEKK